MSPSKAESSESVASGSGADARSPSATAPSASEEATSRQSWPSESRPPNVAAPESETLSDASGARGGQSGAEAGTLTLMVGAGEDDARILLPVLESFSSKVYYFGAAGRGQAAKLCNQVSLASCMMGYADALALAEQSGLDLDQVVDMMCDGMGGSAAMERLAPKSVAGDFRPGFLAEHLRKDLGLALMRADDLDLTLPGAETAFNLYDTLCTVGGSRLGTQAISLLYADEQTGSAAGLDWSRLDASEWEDEPGCAHDHCDHDHRGDGHGHCEHDHCGGGHHHGEA